MKILQICKKFPYPLHDGESIAVNNFASALHEQGCTITLLTMNTSKHYFDVNLIPDSLKKYYSEIITVDIENRVTKWGAFKNLFTNKSYHVSRFENKEFENKLITILSKSSFDIVQLETIQIAMYIPIIRKYSDAKIVIRSHNVEHIIWNQVADNQNFKFNKWYLKMQVRRLKAFEIQYINECDLLMPISQLDLDMFQYLGLKKDALVVPVGLDLNSYSRQNIDTSNCMKMGFIGSLDWIPNQDGLQWFMDTIWDKLIKTFPTLQLEIAGRTAPEWIKNITTPNIHYMGAPSDASSFINRNPIMLVPIIQGSGVRIKILEGMALGRIVITTSAGVEGIAATNYQNIIIADNAEEFDNAIQFCTSHPIKAIEISNAARKFIEVNYDRLEIAKNVKFNYDELISNYDVPIT
jgi:polysaccharide biosynthesis protein PslH